jgi:GGDEF domain-containing protein
MLVTNTGRRGADHLVGRLRGELNRKTPTRGHAAKLTCSFGIADTEIADATTLVGRAEGVLNHPARAGCDRVVIARASREKAMAC